MIIERKGIILAGGSGTRLYPATAVVSKQLLPVYDKPMIYYPLSTLMLAGIREILIIATPEDMPRFSALLGDGSQFGLKLDYAVQTAPNGLAEALIIAEDFLAGAPSALILGDNIFHGNSLQTVLRDANTSHEQSSVFAYRVSDPERYGVVEYDENNRATSIEEKPQNPRSKYAITGLYFYDCHAPKYAKQLKPSQRGELEITDLNNIYLERGSLNVIRLNRGFTWLDTGTHNSLIEAHQFVQTVEKRQDIKIACLEEIAYRRGWINQKQLQELAKPLLKSGYGKYLMQLLTEALPQKPKRHSEELRQGR